MTASRPRAGRPLIGFLLFAAGLFVVGPAEASRTTMEARPDLSAASSEALASASLELSLLERLEPVDTSPRFGFAEDLTLLDPEAGPVAFVVFAAEAAQYELTYARNNPLKYVDPDGKLALEAAAASVATGVSVTTAGGALVTVGALCLVVDLVRPNSYTLNRLADVIVNGLHAEQATGGDAGVYEFPDAREPGKTYVGQSGDVPERIKQHEASGKKEDGSPVTLRPMPGSTKGEREKAEQERINELGGKRTVPGSETSNIVNPVGPKRERAIEDAYGRIYPPTR